MNTEQTNQVLKGIYTQAINMMLTAVSDRRKAIYDYETYLDTVESTLKIFNENFDFEKDLKLSLRGLNKAVLRYVTRLDRKTQKQQLDFYKDIKNSL